MRTLLVAVSVSAVLSLPLRAFGQTEAPPEASARHRGPRTGLLVQGRFTQSVGDGGIGLLGVGALGVLGGVGLGPAIGYRGATWGLSFAPTVAGSSSGEGATASSSSHLGLTVLFDKVLARGVENRLELGLLVGASVARRAFTFGDASDEGVSFGALLGVSTRYWFSPWAGVGVELGESLTSAPVLTTGASMVRGTRALAFGTFGTLNVSIVFGR